MINTNIVNARKELDLKQVDLANAVNVTSKTIGLIESGEYNPTVDLSIAICKTLGKTLDDLFWVDAVGKEIG